MRISNCLHPQRVYNKYLNEFVTVPCGKCDACLNIRAYDWEKRLQQEYKVRKYACFFTLTYSDECLPCFVKYNDCLVSKPRISFVLNRNNEVREKLIYDGLCIPYSKIDLSDERDRKYFDTYNTFCYPSVDDLQKFLKRLRFKLYEFSKKITSSKTFDESDTFNGIRYFIVSEFGGITHRVHYHGLFFFDRPEFVSKMEEFTFESWRMCNREHFDFKFCDASTFPYVTKYLNCNANLPSVYRLRDTRPIAVMSRRPFIGHDSFSKSEIRQIICTQKTSVPFFNSKTKEIAFASLGCSFERRYLPRIFGYSCFNDSDRILAYSVVHRANTSIFSEFFQFIQESLLGCSELCNIIRFIDNHIYVPKDFSFDEMLLLKCNTWRRIFYVCCRVDYIANWLGIDFVKYLQCLFEYYRKKDSENLHNMYNFMYDYVNHPLIVRNSDDLNLMFPDSCLDYLDNLNNCSDFIDMKCLNCKIAEDMRNNKERKSLVRSRKYHIERRVY